MPVMEKLKMFVVQEPVVAASCLIGGVGLFLPAVVRPILDSSEASKPLPQPALSDLSFLSLCCWLSLGLTLYGVTDIIQEKDKPCTSEHDENLNPIGSCWRF